MLRRLLAANGSKVGPRHVKTLMSRTGREALTRRPRTTKPAPGHTIHPYLLRGLQITRPNQVPLAWSSIRLQCCPVHVHKAGPSRFRGGLRPSLGSSPSSPVRGAIEGKERSGGASARRRSEEGGA